MFGSKAIRIKRQSKMIQQQKETIKQKEDIEEKQKTALRQIRDIIKDGEKNKTPTVLIVDKIKELVTKSENNN